MYIMVKKEDTRLWRIIWDMVKLISCTMLTTSRTKDNIRYVNILIIFFCATTLNEQKIANVLVKVYNFKNITKIMGENYFVVDVLIDKCTLFFILLITQ